VREKKEIERSGHDGYGGYGTGVWVRRGCGYDTEREGEREGERGREREREKRYEYTASRKSVTTSIPDLKAPEVWPRHSLGDGTTTSRPVRAAP
jgi:hypothetical protein